MARGGTVVGTLILLALAGCSERQATQDGPGLDADISITDRSGCAAVFAQPAQKKIRGHDPTKPLTLEVGDACQGSKLRVVDFVLLENENQRCEDGESANTHFDVDISANGKRATLTLAEAEQGKEAPGARRHYCYTLQLWRGNEHMHDVDPEIEIIWP